MICKHLCLQIVPSKREASLLAELPQLMTSLRVCTLPLFLPINTATKLSHPVFAAGKSEEELDRRFANAENALTLLRGVLGTM